MSLKGSKTEENVKLYGHQSDINVFKVDYNNRLFITGGLDSKIQI